MIEALPVFRCRKCDRRLNVDAIGGQIRVVVHCRHCKEPNRIEMVGSFRTQVEIKS